MLNFFGSRPGFLFVPIFAVAYNAFLAILNTIGIPVSFAIAALCELLIISGAFFLVARTGFKKVDSTFLISIIAFAVITLYLTILNGKLIIDGLRNFLIIASFALLGMRMSLNEINKVFVWLTWGVLFFLVLEIIDVRLYVAIFEPGNYFAKTRGMEISEFNELGLFNNALGFASRFSFGLFDGPRTSSIFLEQVSLANFATILCLYLLTFYKVIPKKQVLLMMLTVFLIVTSSNTRTTSILVSVLFIGYFVFPLLPRYSNLFVAVSIVIIALFVYFFNPDAVGDNTAGRIRLSMDHFLTLGLSDYFGDSAANLSKLYDSGYAYVIAANTIVGAFIIGYAVLFSIKQRFSFSKRAAFGLTLYVFVNLLIGGTAIYSMKVSSLLWLFVGFVIAYENRKGKSTNHKTIFKS